MKSREARQAPRREADRPGAQPTALAAQRRVVELERQCSELRRAAVEREMERQRLEDLYENAPVGYLTLDRRGRILELNRTAARMFGLAKESLLGLPLELQILREDNAIFLQHLAEALTSVEPCSCQVAFGGVEAGLRFVGHLESVSCLTRSGVRGLRTILSDATLRWREEAERTAILHREQAGRANHEARQARFDRIAAAGSLLAESLDFSAAISGAAKTAVPHLASSCAVDLVDAMGHVRRAAEAHQEDGADLPLDPYAPQGSATVVRTGRPMLLDTPSPGDLLGLTIEPERLWSLRERIASYMCVPLRAHGRVLGAISFVRSSGPPYGPEDLALAEEIARHAALAIDNARLYREAQDADKRKDEFLAMLAHELRNPLAAIVFATACIRRRAGADAVALRTAEVVERQSSRLVRLVDDLLDVSRITRGKVELRRQTVALADVIARAVESTRPLVEQRRHTLSVVQPPEPVMLDADPTRLEQVTVNLLANAATYTSPGGRIELRVARDRWEARIHVRDTGVGIAKDMLTQIFAPFTQINPSPDRKGAGLGIGLTLAQQLVEMHGGGISAHSDGPGRGSEFIVRLPLSDAAPAITQRALVGQTPDHDGGSAPKPPLEAAHDGGSAPKPPLEAAHDGGSAPKPPLEAAPGPNGAAGPPRPAPIGRRRVLVVEDDADVAEMERDQLAALGHDVRIASDGQAAIAAVQEFTPEVLLIDIGLPGMTGYELVRRLREDRALAGAKMVALTGYGGAATRQQCLEAGFDDHFTKPIPDEALQGVLQAS